MITDRTRRLRELGLCEIDTASASCPYRARWIVSQRFVAGTPQSFRLCDRHAEPFRPGLVDRLRRTHSWHVAPIR